MLEMLILLVPLLGLLMLGLVSLSISKTISGFINAGESATVTDETSAVANPNVLAGQPGVLTTRTTDVAGTLTMTNSSHGIITGQRIDLYWTGGQCYGAVVGTVSGTSVPFTLVSGGDVLPIATTAIVAGICESSPFNLVGNNLSALVLSSQVAGYIVVSSNSADLYAVYLNAVSAAEWHTGAIGTNPLAGATPTKVWFSHGSITGTVTTMQAGALYH